MRPAQAFPRGLERSDFVLWLFSGLAEPRRDPAQFSLFGEDDDR
jgi:hypothetical protein